MMRSDFLTVPGFLKVVSLKFAWTFFGCVDTRLVQL